jgi:hypothetical protein
MHRADKLMYENKRVGKAARNKERTAPDSEN